MNSVIPWIGGKSRLLWLIGCLAPSHYSRFIDVFGGSGTVLINRPIRRGCMEIYNDFNSNLTNLFYCVKEKPLALLRELGFLPLNSRDDFEMLTKFFECREFTDDDLKEELELTEILLEPPQAEAIRKLMLERSRIGDVRRGADYFKRIRYSFGGGGNTFAWRNCDIRSFFHLVWECSRRLAAAVIENRSFAELIPQCKNETDFLYCDPPYYEAEKHYEVAFTQEDHILLHDLLVDCPGYVMVSYNFCPFVLDRYKEFYIFYTERPNSLSQEAGSKYAEVIITNYNPMLCNPQFSLFSLFGSDSRFELIHKPERDLKTF